MAVDTFRAGSPVGKTQDAVLGEVGRSRLVVALSTARRSARSGALWGLVFGAYVAAQAFGYVETYKTASERAALATGFGSGGLDALFGRPRQMQTTAGYTAWKSLGVLVVVGAVWGLMTATKALRGEEDRGRWELLLAGRTTPGRAALQAAAGLLAGLVALFAITALSIVAVGASASISFQPAASIFFALAIVAGATMFLGIGALFSELAPTRQQAVGYGALVLAASFAVRTIPDMDAHLRWVAWLTPLGWIEQLAPFTGSRALPLIPILALTLTAVGLAIWIAARRDLDRSVFSDRDTAEPRLALLGGAGGLSVRMALGSLVAWTAGAVALGVLLGGETHVAVKSLDASAGARRVLRDLGGSQLAVDGYLGAALLLTALLACMVATAQVAAGQREESLGRLDRLIVGSVSRTRWWLGRAALAATSSSLVGVLGGCSVWAGASVHPLPTSAGTMLAAVLNTLPPALCVAGVGMLALALVPRWAVLIGYGWVGWSLLMALFGSLTGINHWVLDTSVLHQMTLAPARRPDWTSAVALIAVAVGAAGIGLAIFCRRDLVDE